MSEHMSNEQLLVVMSRCHTHVTQCVSHITIQQSQKISEQYWHNTTSQNQQSHFSGFSCFIWKSRKQAQKLIKCFASTWYLIVKDFLYFFQTLIVWSACKILYYFYSRKVVMQKFKYFFKNCIQLTWKANLFMF